MRRKYRFLSSANTAGIDTKYLADSGVVAIFMVSMARNDWVDGF